MMYNHLAAFITAICIGSCFIRFYWNSYEKEQYKSIVFMRGVAPITNQDLIKTFMDKNQHVTLSQTLLDSEDWREYREIIDLHIHN